MTALSTHSLTHAALLAAVIAEPDDDTPRLAMADLLREEGDSDRAEFIEVQVELARLEPKPREIYYIDGAGKRMEGIGVGLSHHGDGHYIASSLERGLSAESFQPNERVDIYADVAGKKGARWMRGMKFVRHREDNHTIIFRKDEHSKPWPGKELAARSDVLLTANEAKWRRGEPCGECERTGRVRVDPTDEMRRHFEDAGRLTPYMVDVPCPVCRGSGWTGPLSERVDPNKDHPRRTSPAVWFKEDGLDWFWRHEVEWSRGFPAAVHCNLAESITEDGSVPSVTQWILNLFSEWPITRVVIDGRDSPRIVAAARKLLNLPEIPELNATGSV